MLDALGPCKRCKKASSTMPCTMPRQAIDAVPYQASRDTGSICDGARNTNNTFKRDGRLKGATFNTIDTGKHRKEQDMTGDRK